MTACVCIDDAGGISFNSRRQSKDRSLIARLCSRERNIFIKQYSAPLFDGRDVTVTDTYISCDGTAFIELEDAAEYMRDADRVIIYRWNRLYPSDVRLSALPLELGFSLESSEDFEGSSHKKITEEVWVK